MIKRLSKALADKAQEIIRNFRLKKFFVISFAATIAFGETDANASPIEGRPEDFDLVFSHSEVNPLVLNRTIQIGNLEATIQRVGIGSKTVLVEVSWINKGGYSASIAPLEGAWVYLAVGNETIEIPLQVGRTLDANSQKLLQAIPPGGGKHVLLNFSKTDGSLHWNPDQVRQIEIVLSEEAKVPALVN